MRVPRLPTDDDGTVLRGGDGRTSRLVALVGALSTGTWLLLSCAPPAASVIGGRDATSASVVQLTSNAELLPGTFLTDCTAIVLDTRWVLPARHCVTVQEHEDDGTETEVGPMDRTEIALRASSAGPTVGVAQIVLPADYDVAGARGDVALLRLDAPLRDVEPVLLLDDADALDGPLVHLGWGDLASVAAGEPLQAATTLQQARCRSVSHDPAALEALGLAQDRDLLVSVCDDDATVTDGDSGGATFLLLPDGRLALVGVISSSVDEAGPDAFVESVRLDHGSILDAVDELVEDPRWVDRAGPPARDVEPRAQEPVGGPGACCLV